MAAQTSENIRVCREKYVTENVMESLAEKFGIPDGADPEGRVRVEKLCALVCRDADSGPYRGMAMSRARGIMNALCGFGVWDDPDDPYARIAEKHITYPVSLLAGRFPNFEIREEERA